MIRTISLLVIFSLLILIPHSSCAEDVPQDENFGQHFIVSILFGAIGETIVHNRETFGVPMKIFAGTVLGSVPGLIKEISDSSETNNSFSEDQILYDVAGSAVGSVIAYKFNSRTKVNVSKEEDGGKIFLRYSY